MKINLTKRDKRMLTGMYYYRCLTAKQIRIAYYDGTQSVYHRLSKLKKEGYLESRPVLEKARKVAQAYWLTQKAIDELDIKDKRHASKNAPHANAKYKGDEKVKINKIVQLNSIPITFITTSPNEEWEWVESREVKKAYKIINQNSPLAGLLKTKYSETYGVFFTIQADYLTHEKYSQIIVNEIARLSMSLPLTITPLIFAHSEKIYKQYTEIISEEKNMLMLSKDTRLVPYTENILAFMSRVMNNYNVEIAKVIERLTGEPKEKIKPSQKYYATHESEKEQYAEIITFPIHTLALLAKYIGLNTAKPVNLIAWRGQKEEIAKHIPNYEAHKNINVIYMSMKTDPLIQVSAPTAYTYIEPKVKKEPVITRTGISLTLSKEYVEFLNKEPSIENISKHIDTILSLHDEKYLKYKNANKELSES